MVDVVNLMDYQKTKILRLTPSAVKLLHAAVLSYTRSYAQDHEVGVISQVLADLRELKQLCP